MNYAGSFHAALFPDGPGGHAQGNVDGTVRFGAPPAHAPADAIVIPDAHVLFNGDFKRSGTDLILSADGHEFVLHDYFKGEKRAPLASPDGAHLTGDIVSALTGTVQVSQADGTAAAGKVIGHVTKLQGTATAIRNGVSIILHQGDNVEKGDVVQSGSDSTLGITFVDGTVFGLSSNARMVLNEMVYDANGSNNSTLFSLVAGTISFVAGQTAKHGDMKIDTPVATMGIRGTAVLVQIDFDVSGQGGTPGAKFQVLVEPDGRTGSYVLLDKTTLQPLALVDQAGQQISIQNGVISQTDTTLPPDVQKLINDVFTLKFTDNTNPKSNTHFTDVGVLETTPLKFADGGVTPAATFLVSNTPNSLPTIGPTDAPFHIPGPPSAVVLDASSQPSTHFTLTERVGKTGDAIDADVVSGKISYADVNGGDHPSASVTFKSFAYANAQHIDVSGSLNALQLKAIAATEINIAVVQDPARSNIGTATWTYSIPDHAFDFLAAGETLTLTYIVRVDNNFDLGNEFTEVPITITVTGTNDAPVITTGAQTIALSAGTSTHGGSLTAEDPTAGSLSFADVDLTDRHTVSTKLSSAVLQGGGSVPLALFEQAFSASLAADSTGTGKGAINWSLAGLPADVADIIPAGQTLTLTYAVTLTDSQGATSEQTVTVTITGTENPGEIWIGKASGTDGEERAASASALLWRDGANWKTGHAPTANDDVIIKTDASQGLTPDFPVTIDQDAFAKTVTMDDAGGGSTPELDNLSTLTIGGALTLHADAIVQNAGTMRVGGEAELLDQSVLENFGTLVLAGGGDFGPATGVTNTGTIELSAGTLHVSAEVVNSGSDNDGLIQVDAPATLVLEGGAIVGGGITVAGMLELDGGSVLSEGWLANFGTITVSGSGNALDGETVTANNALNILAGATLTLDLGTVFDNNDGTITVNKGATLSLNDAGIIGGHISNVSGGTVALTGLAALIGWTLGNSGDLAVKATGNVLYGETVTNESNATITIAVAGALALTDATITGGTVHNSGEIDVVGDSTLDGSAVDGGAIMIGGPAWQDGGGDDVRTVALFEGEQVPVTLTLKNGVVVTDGDLAIGPYSILDVATAGGATLSGVNVTNCGAIDVDAKSVLVLAHSSIGGGDLVNAGTVHVETNAASTFDNVDIDNGAAGAIVVDDDGGTPVPSTLVLDGDTTIAGGTISIGMAGTLEIHGIAVTLSDTHVDNAGTFTVDSGAILDLAGTSVTGDGTFQIFGTLEATGFNAIGGAVINDGTIEVKSGTLDIGGAISGTGSIVIDQGGTLELGGADALVVKFVGDGSSELVLDAAGSVKTVQGLGISDKLDLTAVKFADDPTATYDAKSGLLTVSDSAGHTVSLTLSGTIDYSHAHFASSDDGHGGTLITLSAKDDAPTVAADDAAQAGTIHERADTSGSSQIDGVSGSIHFGDIDLTDRPIATMSTPALTWTAANHTTDMTASLTPGQITALDQALTIQQSGNTNNGTVDWGYKIADGALDFLGFGQTLTVTSTVTIDDHQGGKIDVPVTVTIDGAEDAPVILGETNPAVQTVILAKSPIVLAAGTTLNTAGLATETFDQQQAGSASNNGHGHGDFYSTALQAWIDADGNAGIVHGSSSVSAAPYVGQGAQDGSNYLSIGAHAQATITFDHQQNSFGLYWGSVDAYNSIDFYNGNKLVAAYDGSDVAPLLANGGQGSFASNGYVEFLDLAPFTKVVLHSSQNAFEIDNVSAGYLDDSHVKLASAIGGTLTVTDKDIGDTLTASVIGDATIKYNGSSHLPGGLDVDALVDAGAIKFDSVSSDGKTDLLHWTYDPAGASLDFLEPGDTLTVTYQAQVSDGHGSFGLQPLTVTITGNGSPAVVGTAQNDTFDDVGGGVIVFGKGGNDTFVFTQQFGSATIADFDVNKDTLEVNHALFGASTQDILNSAHAANAGHDTVLVDAAHETITLKGVTLAQLTAHPNDFHIV
ncbi:VCBS domain-containing protein [Bradyrhizobium sp. STM 3557]|uniref:Npun_F0296 family exosortase-dependent surface protein n=1 Tax=Bradyrhizobium sp. STM 3557 TaxID=578920 RepID=UPI00388E2ACB